MTEAPVTFYGLPIRDTADYQSALRRQCQVVPEFRFIANWPALPGCCGGVSLAYCLFWTKMIVFGPQTKHFSSEMLLSATKTMRLRPEMNRLRVKMKPFPDEIRQILRRCLHSEWENGCPKVGSGSDRR